MSKLTAMYVSLKGAVISTYNNIKFITGTFTNIRANGYSVPNISILSPYGQGSIPVTNMRAIITPIEDSNKQYFCLGFQNTLPPISSDYIPVEGESWNFSKKYTLMYKNTGLVAYKHTPDAYHATLVSGEWMQKILTDIIDDNNTTAGDSTIRGYINNIIVPAFASLGVTLTPIVLNPNLTSDKTAIANNEILITDNGTLP